jgi:hypothetical protein
MRRRRANPASNAALAVLRTRQAMHRLHLDGARRRKINRAVVARTIIDGTVGAMNEYKDSIAFAIVSARSRQLSDGLFKIAHGTTLAGFPATSGRLHPVAERRPRGDV